MSIPTPFNPMGTLGAVEMPYVQPFKTGNGLHDHSNTPSFGFELPVTSSLKADNFGPNAWKMFQSREDPQFVGPTGGVYYRTQKLVFEAPLKVLSVDIIGNPPSQAIEPYYFLLGEKDGQQTELARLATPSTQKLTHRLIVENPQYFDTYIIGQGCTGSTQPVVIYWTWYKTTINAVYRA